MRFNETERDVGPKVSEELFSDTFKDRERNSVVVKYDRFLR